MGFSARILVWVAMVSLGAPPAAAQLNFETPIPRGFGNDLAPMPPRDNLVISGQYVQQFGVRFALEMDNGPNGVPTPLEFPILEASGQQSAGQPCPIAIDAFTCGPSCSPQVCDTEAPINQGQLGNFFLRFPPPRTNPADHARALFIIYSPPGVSNLSFELWDVEPATESWLVETFTNFNLTGAPTVITGTGGGDGQPTLYSVTSANPPILVIRVTYTGLGNNPGLAFDNFNVTLPPTWADVPPGRLAWWPGGIPPNDVDSPYVPDFGPFGQFNSLTVQPEMNFVLPTMLDTATGAGALCFNGGTHFASLTPSTEIKDLAQGPFSVDVMFDTAGSGLLPVVEVNDGDDPTETGFRLDVLGAAGNNDRLDLLVCDAGVCESFSSMVSATHDLNDSDPHLIGFTYDPLAAPKTRFFVDCDELALGTAVGGLGLGTETAIQVGKSQVDMRLFPSGCLDELEIFTGVLTPTEMCAKSIAGAVGRCESDFQVLMQGTAGCDGCEVRVDVAPCALCACNTDMDCSVTLTTTIGQSAASMAKQLAMGINANPDITGQGIWAIASGPVVQITGGALAGGISTDPTLDLLIEPVVVALPALPPAAIGALCAGLILLAVRRLRGRR
jgi:hypothetical protein